ncbi:hypothetical protein [Yoonia sp. BS5-3]|uniref:Uncharacterized protein n=1 Tax=Yoonia phaeophyticola TaxID=3137369 RepID=A0ABZ2VAQ9_9RHOB
MGLLDIFKRKPKAEAPSTQIDILLRDTDSLAATVETLRNAGAGDADIPVTRPVVDGVVEVLALNAGPSFQLMSSAHLDQQGLSYDAARDIAMARLRAAAADLTVEGGGGRYRARFTPDLDLSASFLLTTETWLDLDALDGPPVFAVGTRVSIHACGANDPDSVAGMKEIAAVMHAESVADPVANGRPLTPQLLTIKGGVLGPFDA